MEKKVTKDMLIGDMLVLDRGIGVILMQSGMHCVGCPSSAGELLMRLVQYTVWTVIKYLLISTNILQTSKML